MLGAVVSCFTVNFASSVVTGGPDRVTMQSNDRPGSEVTVAVSQPLVDVTPVGSQLKATVTSLRYHPEEHVPPLHVTVSGAALAAETKTSIDKQPIVKASG